MVTSQFLQLVHYCRQRMAWKGCAMESYLVLEMPPKKYIFLMACCTSSVAYQWQQVKTIFGNFNFLCSLSCGGWNNPSCASWLSSARNLCFKLVLGQFFSYFYSLSLHNWMLGKPTICESPFRHDLKGPCLKEGLTREATPHYSDEHFICYACYFSNKQRWHNTSFLKWQCYMLT